MNNNQLSDIGLQLLTSEQLRGFVKPEIKEYDSKSAHIEIQKCKFLKVDKIESGINYQVRFTAK